MKVFLRPMIKAPGSLFIEFELRRLVIPELSLMLAPETGLITRQPFYDGGFYVGALADSEYQDGVMLELSDAPASITMQAQWRAIDKDFFHVVHYAFYDPDTLPPGDNPMLWSPISPRGEYPCSSGKDSICLHIAQPCMAILPTGTGPAHDDYIKDSLIIHREDTVELPVWLDTGEDAVARKADGRRDIYLETEGLRCLSPQTVQ